MKAFLLAAAVAAGMLCTAGTADAQYRYRGYSYGYPAYSYAAPSYYSGGVVTSSYYAPSVAPAVYPGGSYYDTRAWAPTYSTYPAYYGGVNVYPSGMYYGGRSMWRW